MLKENLTENTDYAVPYGAASDVKKHLWVVAEFNAWLEQSGGKTWWAILNSVKRALWPRWPQGFSFSDTLWRLRRRWQHWIISGVFLAFFLIATTTISLLTPSQVEISRTVTTTKETITPTEESYPSNIKVTDKEVKKYPVQSKNIFATLGKFLGILTTLGALFAIFNKLSPRARKTSEAIVELDDKPLAPLTERFHKMITGSKKPVAVFIDDLDRCDADYVVDVLQVLQTAYSKTPVLYVVAADRDWIVSAYEQKYEKFKTKLDKPGQPMGYLFLKKIFQMSITLPDLSEGDKTLYLGKLLAEDTSFSTAPQMADTQLSVETPERPANELRQNKRDKEIVEIVKEKDIELKERIPHRLTKHTQILEANPRAIKRLINAFGYKYLYAKLGGFEIDPDDLVVWSVLELRFPFVAYRLLQNPELVNRDARKDENLNDEDKLLFAEADITNILEKLSQDTVKKMRDIS